MRFETEDAAERRFVKLSTIIRVHHATYWLPVNSWSWSNFYRTDLLD